MLNEGAFENYISLLSKDQKQLNVFYTRSAFLRDIEKVEALIGYTKALTRIKINAATNSTFLNSWTPSPLTLAGMIVAERASKAQHCRKPDNRSTSFNSLEDDEPEVALNAVDLLNDTSSDTLPSISMDDSSLFAQSERVDSLNFQSYLTPLLRSQSNHRRRGRKEFCLLPSIDARRFRHRSLSSKLCCIALELTREHRRIHSHHSLPSTSQSQKLVCLFLPP